MPPKKRPRRQAVSDMTEQRPSVGGSGMVTLNVAALTASISNAVSQAVQQAFEKAPSAGTDTRVRTTVRQSTEEITGTVAENPGVSDIHVIEGTRSNNLEPATPLFSSITIPLGSTVSAKLKAKIWANEFVHFSVLLQPSSQQERFSLSLSPLQGASQPQLTLEPSHSKKFIPIHQWVTAFHIFATIYCEKLSGEAGKLMKYCEIVRDIANKPGDWAMYDEQFRFLRQSAPDQYPWEAVHWELWLKATTNFRPKHAQEKANTRPKARQPFQRGACWNFNAGKSCFAGCRYDHKCSKCGAQHAALQCRSVPEQHSAPQRNGQATSATNVKEYTSHARKGGSA